MSNYRWLTYSDDDVSCKSPTVLCTSTLEPIGDFPCIPGYLMDELLEKELWRRKIYFEVDGQSCSYHLIPEELQFVSVSAPLYRENKETGTYQKLSDSYTATVINPEQKNWVKNEFTRSQAVVSQAQASKFQKLFDENTLDNGLTSCFEITSLTHNIGDYFCEKYVPSNFFAICQISPRSLTGQDETKKVLFMRKINAAGKIVTIKVPKYMKGAVIGVSGQNIRQLAKKINAGKIRVI